MYGSIARQHTELHFVTHELSSKKDSSQTSPQKIDELCSGYKSSSIIRSMSNEQDATTRMNENIFNIILLENSIIEKVESG